MKDYIDRRVTSPVNRLCVNLGERHNPHAFCSQFALASLIQPQSPSGILNRSLSAPPKLDRSMSVQEGIHDVRRLQRWRTNVQRKHNRSTSEDETDASVNKTFLSTVAEIFFFIGSDPDKAVSRNIAICS